MKFRLFFVITTFLLFQISDSSAQNYKSDFALTARMHEDTNKVRKLVEIYDKYYFMESDSNAIGFKNILEAYHLAVKLNDKKGITATSFRVGLSLKFLNNKDKAIYYLFICIKNAEETRDYVHYYKAQQNLGLIYYNQHKWKDALNYFQKVIDMKKDIPGKKRLQMTSIYLSGLCYIETGESEKARKYLDDALQYAVSSKDSNRMHECFVALGRTYAHANNFLEAKIYFDKALKYYTAQKEKVALALIFEQLAKISVSENNIGQAIEIANKAYKNAKETPSAINLAEITDLLHRLYSQKGNYELAYKYLLENNNIKDSISLKDISTQIALAQSNYEFEKREDKFTAEINEKDRKKNQAFWLAGIVGLFLIGAAVSLGFLRKERKKSEKLLLNILPQETAQELKKYGKAIPRKHESVTIMFCDVKNFTLISENLSPEILVNMLDIYISRFDEIIHKHGLEKIKTIGDAYMCAGGLHSGFDDHAVKTVLAAMEILNFVKDINAEMMQKYGHAFLFRIGIHTGPVVSGVVGHHKYAYDIWGDTVNTAARMEEKSEPGEINISGVTYSMIFSRFEARFRGMIEAKNKAPMEMYFINQD